MNIQFKKDRKEEKRKQAIIRELEYWKDKKEIPFNVLIIICNTLRKLPIQSQKELKEKYASISHF